MCIRDSDRIKVDYYGVPTPVNQMAGVKTPEAHLLVIEPWDKGMLRAIEHAILESDLGVTPNNDGSVIRLPFPSLTEERRRDLVKQLSLIHISTGDVEARDPYCALMRTFYRLLFEAMLGRNQRKEEESCCSIAMKSR